jgi:hypothetical protein
VSRASTDALRIAYEKVPSERRLVEEAAQADCFFQRNTRQYMAAERALHLQQANAVLWTDQQHKIRLRFERYKAAAQRAFSQAVRLLEQVRKNRLMGQDRAHRATNEIAHNGHQTPCALHCREMERALRAKRDEQRAELDEAKAGLRRALAGETENAVGGEAASSVQDRTSGAVVVVKATYESGSGRS